MMLQHRSEGYKVYSLSGGQPQLTYKKVLRSKKLAHPNPANTTITLPYKLEDGASATMNIYNIKGKLIETKKKKK